MTDDRAPAKIRWVDANARNVHVNSCSVAGTREEISLLFGNEPVWSPGSPAAPIQITDRIILSPFVAKQLATVLEHTLKNHEATYGSLEGDAGRPTPADRQARAAFLFQLVKDLDIAIGYEQSFKITEKNIYDHRFLLGLSKKEIEYRAQERIIEICKRLEMPETLLEIFRQCLFDVNYVHFGFEEKGNTCLYKVYVEFWDSIRETMRHGRNVSGPFLLHLGFKWNPFDRTRTSMTRYTWHPRLTVPEMLARAGALLDSDHGRHVIEIAEGIVNLAATRIPHQDILYLEVTEDGNPRKSFDINVYRAGLQIGELYLFLASLGQHYAVSHGAFHQLYDHVKAKRFGHLSGGVSRDGNDFCTVYYGVEPLYGDQAGQQVHRTGEPLSAPTGNRWSRPAALADSVEKTDDDAAMLLRLVKDLNVPFGFERSFKIMETMILPDRYLIGIERRGMGVEQNENVLNICRQMNMPEDFIEHFRGDLPQADIGLFGFEKDMTKRLYKVYLEFNDRLKKAVEENPNDPYPFLMFTGYKWEVSNNARKVITHYTCFPALILRDMAERTACILDGPAGISPYRIVEGILDLAANRAGPGDFLYIEATEDNNPRKSFDINVYQAGLRLAEIYPLLLDMIKHYSVPVESFHRIYEAAKTMLLGHVAGGIDREGRDFLTIYFSDKWNFRQRRIEPGLGGEKTGRQ